MRQQSSLARVARRVGEAAIVLVLACAWAPAVAAQGPPTVTSLYDWQAAPGPSTASFSDVAVDGTQRLYAGYLFDAMSLTLVATLFSSAQPPGAALALHDLGFTVDPSLAVSIASQGGGRHWVAVSQSDGVTGTTAHVLDWAPAGPVVQTQRVGPPPALGTDVTPHAVNRLGTAVGRLDGTVALVSPDGADAWTVAGTTSSEMFGVSPDGSFVAGTADFGTGTSVATIWDETGAVAYQDTVEGRIRALAPRFAVGTRDGVATWWRRLPSGWQPFEVTEGGTPVAGELLAIDRDGFGIAGGTRDGGGAIVVNLRNSQLIDLEEELALAPGTLWAVHGIDADGGSSLAAFAVEAADFSGWDVTASFTTDVEPVPGPAAWLVAPLAATGGALLARRARRSRAGHASSRTG